MCGTRVISLSTLPSEIIIKIFSYLETHQDVLSASLSAPSLQVCGGENPIWRNVAYARWKHKRFNLAAGGFSSWKDFYIHHHLVDNKIDEQVNNMVHQPDPPGFSRIARFQHIQPLENDCKDRLLMHIRTPDDALDVLARRYWARALLTSMYRVRAIKTIRSSLRDGSLSLEDALISLDMFICDDEPGDYESIHGMLEDLTNEFKKAYPDYQEHSTRSLALLLAHYLITEQGFRGSNEDSFYSVQNNFIGTTLTNPSRPGLPIIYIVIFCSIAKRIGLDARPIGLPHHVFAVVQPPDGFDLGGNSCRQSGESERMFLDLYSLGDTIEIPETVLRQIIDQLGHRNAELYFHPLSAMALLVRMRWNLQNCMQRERENRGLHLVPGAHLWNTLQDIMYLVYWLSLILEHSGAMSEATFDGHRAHLMLIQLTGRAFPGDLIEVADFLKDVSSQVNYESMLQLYIDDENTVHPKPRDADIRERIFYKVGTYFQHRKYDYSGFIIGWDSQCEEEESWQMMHGVNTLQQGATQCFYHAMYDFSFWSMALLIFYRANDGSSRYVAQENIGPIVNSRFMQPPTRLMKLAGEYFLRWDDQQHMFISNLKKEYPDD